MIHHVHLIIYVDSARVRVTIIQEPCHHPGSPYGALRLKIQKLEKQTPLFPAHRTIFHPIYPYLLDLEFHPFSAVPHLL